MTIRPEKPARVPKRSRHQPTPASVHNFRLARAITLDRLADQQLQAGFHHQAERLAHQADELRDYGR